MSTISKTGENKGASYEIQSDPTANTLSLTLSGPLTVKESKQAANEMLLFAVRLEDEFEVEIDRTAFEPASSEAAEPIDNLGRALEGMGGKNDLDEHVEETLEAL